MENIESKDPIVIKEIHIEKIEDNIKEVITLNIHGLHIRKVISVTIPYSNIDTARNMVKDITNIILSKYNII